MSKEFDFESVLKKWNEEKKYTGIKLRKRLLEASNPKYDIRRLRREHRWTKRIVRQLSKQKYFYIKNWECFDQCGTWLDSSDVLFKIGNKWKWIFTIDNKKNWEYYLKEVQEIGGEIKPFKPDDNMDTFDCIYFDEVEMKNGEDYIKYVREWVKIWFPDMVDKIIFVEED